MKALHEPLENGLIPLVEIAKLIYVNQDENDSNYVDFNKPEFFEDKLLVNFYGDKNGNGITEYLFFDDMQFKLKVYDCYWTGDTNRNWIQIINRNQIPLLKKLIELGVLTNKEIEL